MLSIKKQIYFKLYIKFTSRVCILFNNEFIIKKKLKLKLKIIFSLIGQNYIELF